MLKYKQKPKSQPDVPEAPVLSFKERLAQKRKADRLRKELITFTIFAFLFSTVIGFLIGLISDPRAGIGATVGVLYTALSFKYPRQALWAFLIYMPFSGTITYVIGSSPLLQLAKDGFYIPALIGVIQYCRRERLPIIVSKPLVPPLLLVLGLSMLTLIFVNGGQHFTPSDLENDNPLAVGILGLKVLLGYVPLIVCAYYLIRNKQDLLFLMRLTIVLVLVCCGLGFLQYVLLKTGYCTGTQNESGASLFRASLQARCLVGGALLYSPEHGQIRLPGTFVAPWQWGWFLISAGFLTFASSFNDPQIRWRTLGLISLASVFIMAVLSGQRIALALVPLTFVLLLILTGQVVQLKRFIPTAIGLAIVLGGIAVSNPEVLQQRVDSFESRWNASPPHEFIINQFNWAWGHQETLLGNGLGRATNAARSLGETQLIETYYPKVMYEVGLVGVLAFLLFVTVLVYVTFQAYRATRDRNLRNYAASFWVFVLFISYNTYFYPLDVDPVAVYYWFFAGVTLKLPEIARQERLEMAGKEKIVIGRKRIKRRGFA